MKSSKSTAFDSESGTPKPHKKVSFDVKPRAMNFARKSTGPHSLKRISKLTPSKCRGLRKKCMHLELNKVDISGYDIPRLPVVDCECSDLYGCARLLPVDESMSCARTSVVRNKHWKKSFGSEISRILKTQNKGVLKKIDVSRVLKGVLKHNRGSHCLSKPVHKKSRMKKISHHTPVLKKGESRKREREPEVKHVKFSEAMPADALVDLCSDGPCSPCSSLVHSSTSTPPSAEAEYELKLKETIEKISEESSAKRRKVHEEVVKLPLDKIVPPTSCTLQVKTLSVTTSKGIQADRGFVVNEEVMDSLVSVKISETLYSMKERLHSVEEQLKKVTEEKLKMENVLKEKVQMIRELAMNGFKPNIAHKAVNTDSSNANSPPSEDKKAAKTPVKRLKQQKAKSRHISTQTDVNDQSMCLKPMTSTSLKPYLQFRPPSASPEPEVGQEDVVEQNSKVEWMFHSTDTCARTHAIRSQVRLLRALKKNLEKHRPALNHELRQCEGVIPDEIGWDSMGSEMQAHFIRLYKLMHLLKLLPVVSALKASSDKVSETLKHLLSHLPFPNSVTHTIDISKIRQPRTDAMASYLFGWKLKEIINVLRSVYFNKVVNLPSYLKAEIVQADRLVYEHLVFAVQGMRNMTISHTSNSDADFLAGDMEVPMPDYCTKICDLDSSDSCSDLSDYDESPSESPKQTRRAISREESTDSTSHKEQDESAKVVKRLTLKQLMTISDIVQSRIAKLRKMSLMPNPLKPNLPLKPDETLPKSAESFIDVANPKSAESLSKSAESFIDVANPKSAEFLSKSAEPKSIEPSAKSLPTRVNSLTKPAKPLPSTDGLSPLLQSVQRFMSHGISGPAQKSMASYSQPLTPTNPSSPGCSGSPHTIQGRLLNSPIINHFTDLSKAITSVCAVDPPSTLAADKLTLAHRLTWTEKGMQLSSAVSLRPPEAEAGTMTCARVTATTPSTSVLVSRASQKTIIPTPSNVSASSLNSPQSSLSTPNQVPPQVVPQSPATSITLRMPISAQLQHALLASSRDVNLSVADALKKSGIHLSRDSHSLQLKLLPNSLNFSSSNRVLPLNSTQPLTSMPSWTSTASSSMTAVTSSSQTTVVMTTTADQNANNYKKGAESTAILATSLLPSTPHTSSYSLSSSCTNPVTQSLGSSTSLPVSSSVAAGALSLGLSTRSSSLQSISSCSLSSSIARPTASTHLSSLSTHPSTLSAILASTTSSFPPLSSIPASTSSSLSLTQPSSLLVCSSSSPNTSPSSSLSPPASSNTSLSPASPATLTNNVRNVIASAEPLDEPEDTLLPESSTSSLQAPSCDPGSAAAPDTVSTADVKAAFTKAGSLSHEQEAHLCDTMSHTCDPISKSATVGKDAGKSVEQDAGKVIMKAEQQATVSASLSLRQPSLVQSSSDNSKSVTVGKVTGKSAEQDESLKAEEQATVSASLGLRRPSLVQSSSDNSNSKSATVGKDAGKSAEQDASKAKAQATVSAPLGLQPSVVQSSSNNQLTGADSMSEFIFSKPTILKATREDTAVTIKWTFSSHLQPFVSKYAVFYAHKKTFVRDPQWRLIGYTESLALPMTCTLNQQQCISITQECIFTISACFVNGLTSQTSDPAIV